MATLKLPRVSIPGLDALNAAWAAWVDAIEYNDNLTGAGGIRVSKGPAGPVVAYTRPGRMWVKLTSSAGGGAYAATEQVATAGGGHANAVSPWTGTVREQNGNATITLTTPPVVEVFYFQGVDEWRFQLGTC